MARAAVPESERKDFYLYADEFQNLVTQTFENLLSEARKYAICLTVAHQYMQQLLPGVQSAVLGNVGTIIIFRVGGEDAVRLKPEMMPVFDIKDMINLGVQQFYIKMTIDGETFDPFSAETLKVGPSPHESYREEIIELSRKKYSIPADAAKKLIAKEESEIIRNAQEKAAISGGEKSGDDGGKKGDSGPASQALKPAAKETSAPII